MTRSPGQGPFWRYPSVPTEKFVEDFLTWWKQRGDAKWRSSERGRSSGADDLGVRGAAGVRDVDVAVAGLAPSGSPTDLGLPRGDGGAVLGCTRVPSVDGGPTWSWVSRDRVRTFSAPVPDEALFAGRLPVVADPRILAEDIYVVSWSEVDGEVAFVDAARVVINDLEENP